MKAILTFSRLGILVCIAVICGKGTAFAQLRSGWEKEVDASFDEKLINHLQSVKDTVYIQDRKKLRRVRHRHCTSNGVRFADSSLSLFIEISQKPFDSLHHKFQRIKDTSKDTLSDTTVYRDSSESWYVLVDDAWTYGADFEYASQEEIKEITKFKIIWNGVTLTIPRQAYHDLYNAWLCDSHAQPVEAYITKDSKLLYIYVSGSDASESYAVKFVFDRKGYVSRILSREWDCKDPFDFFDATCD